MYLFPFRNNDPDHDFTLITDTIKEYYPVGKGKRLTSETTASYPGFIKAGQISNAEYMNHKAYDQKWGKLTTALKKIFKNSVFGYPDPTNGGFFGEIVIHKDKQPDFLRQKTLQFHISIIGPFFSIHGADSSIALLPIEPLHSQAPDIGHFAATHVITVSPVFEYSDVFITLEDELRKFFPGHRFIPYEVGMSTMKNISIADNLRDPRTMDTIYEALYGRKAVHDCPTRGDERYGMGDWSRPLDARETSLVDQVFQHIIDTTTDTSIHKVWKFQTSKQLDTLEVTGNLMFGMDLFDVLDLTDDSQFITLSTKRGAPSTGKYKIRKGIIEITPEFSFRIVELSQDALTLNLILNIDGPCASINGEAAEIKFIQMKRLA